MSDFPRTAIEFEDRFATEEACEAYFFELRWPDGFECPKCRNRGGWRLPSRPRLIECSACGKQTSLTAGTTLHGTRKSLREWFKTMFLMTTQKYGVSAKNIERQLGFCYETAWTWLHKLRAAMGVEVRSKLKGHVECDEAYVGGEEPGVFGRGSERKALVHAAVEVHPQSLGRARLTHIPDASGATLSHVVSTTVSPDAEVYTDGWTGYSGLARCGFTHRPRIAGRGRAAARRLPHVHLVLSLLKTLLRGTHQGAVRPQHLQSYLNEWVFRFNRRRCRFATGIFERLARVVARGHAMATYRSIVQLRHANPLRTAA